MSILSRSTDTSASILTVTILTFGLLGAPAVAEAQEGPPFEPPGPPPGVIPPVGHDRSGVPPPHSNSPLVSSSGSAPDVVAAVSGASAEVETALASGSLTAPSGASIRPSVQRALLHVLRDAPEGDVDSFVAALESPANVEARSAAAELGARLTEIRQKPASLGEAVASYNHFIDASSVEFLQDPPPELLALQSALGTMVRAAVRAADDAPAGEKPPL